MSKKLKVFSGPCVLESMELADFIASYLNNNLANLSSEIDFYFKGSFDKANRSSKNSFRGEGIKEGLKILETIKQKYKLPVLTDFHLPDQAEEVASVVDVLQIPAFLCRQTDMIVAGALAAKKYNRILKIKKGQFLSPNECENIVEKAEAFLPKDQIFITERGTTFGYNNLVVDMASFQIIKSFGVKAIFDATHAVQMPGGLKTATGGKRDQVEVLAKAAIAAGADGVFLETHPEPQKALSDAATCLELSKVTELINTLVRIKKVVS